MSLHRKLMRAYFNLVYNPVYDFTTARLNRYRELQERCVRKLELKENDRLLCVGLGTGNEIIHILEANRNVDIVGIDYSNNALRKAGKKALRFGKAIECLLMDARYMKFATGSFDKVLCIHVMDFAEEDGEVTNEILRVLKDRGQFVITYPSDRENAGLGIDLLRDGFRHSSNSGKHRARALLEVFVQMLVGMVYLPFLFRPKRKTYSRSQLEAVIGRFTSGDFQIDEDSLYRDFIVCGRKSSKGGGPDAHRG